MRLIKILFLSLLFPLLIPKIGEAATKAAVIIGISHYPEEANIPDLQFAARDAQNLSAFLKQRGYQPYTLIDGEATKENLKGGIDAFARNAIQEPFEQVLFYFSGRGTRVPDERMPPDEDDGQDECLLLSDAKAEKAETYLRDDELLQLLARIKTNIVLFIVDCSFGTDPESVSVKGFGGALARELDGVHPMKEGDISLQNALVLSASKPEEGAVDGVLMPALLSVLDAEEADTTGERRLSVAEVHQYLKGALDGKQTPQLFDPWQLNPILVDLPPLPMLQISSNPSGAEIFITPVERVRPADSASGAASPFPPSDQEMRKPVGKTPLQLKLKKGKYRVNIQKSGFRSPPAQEIELNEYDKSYTLESFTLRPIGVHGTVVDSRGNPIGDLIAQFQQGDKIIEQKRIGVDGIFHLSPEQDHWLQLDQKYSVTITERNVLRSDDVTFTFTGYEDISFSILVSLDTVSPELMRVEFSSSRTAPDKNRLLPGDEVTITLIARDDGLGVESAKLALGRSGTNELLPLKPGTLQGEAPDSVYQFQYPITETPSAIEEWSVAQLELMDEGGNSHLYRRGEVNLNFTVFPDLQVMGESYFKEKAYTQSLIAFGLSEVQTDRSRYLTTLAHYELKSLQRAIETFLTITDQRTYLGLGRKPPPPTPLPTEEGGDISALRVGEGFDLPPMPRPLINKLWGRYLDGLPQNRQNPEYFDLLAVTAQALNRPEDAKLYQEHRDMLLAGKKTGK
ncbi:caspase family protein [Candidatus Poribacteria bacterium]|nr:caspase family protein [Candidatus Poribacteria bacterium]